MPGGTENFRRLFTYRRLAIVTLASASLAVVIPGGAIASPLLLVDQQQTSNWSRTGFFSGEAYGQTFVPTLNRIDAAEFQFAVLGTTSVQLDVFSGIGYGGTLLGTGVVAVSGSGTQMVHIDLDAPASLTPNSPHTLKVTNIGSGPLNIDFDSRDPYAAGTMLWLGGVAWGSGNADLIFVEGLHTVPEPAAFTVATLALLLSLGMVPRYKHPAAR